MNICVYSINKISDNTNLNQYFIKKNKIESIIYAIINKSLFGFYMQNNKI